MNDTDSLIRQLDLESLPEETREALLVKCFQHAKNRGGRLPLLAFYAKVDAFPTPFVETFTCCEGDSGWEVLLEERPPDDPFFGGKFHIPGTTLPRRTPFGLTVAKTAGESIPWGVSEQAEFMGVIHMPNVIREHAVSIAFLRRLKQKVEPKSGAFYPLSALPTPLVVHQEKAFIPLLRRFLETDIPSLEEYLGATE